MSQGNTAPAAQEPPARGWPIAVDALIERALVAAEGLAAHHRSRAAPQQSQMAHRSALAAPGAAEHAADERADLYALGASLYEWATGRPPFEERDPLKLVHEQLTFAPPAPLEVRSELPQVLSDIILRLLESEPERRYHGAEGLVHDLKRLKRAAAGGTPVAFPLGERDFPPRLAPQELAGREAELEEFGRLLDDAANGATRVLLLHGAPGVGKSSYVAELRRQVGARNGRFVSGKFEPHSRGDPSVIIDALGALGRLLLTESDEELAVLRASILQELGPIAGVATDIPEFKLLLGDFSEHELPDRGRASARLEQVVLGVMRAVASPERPLVLALDDVQWSRHAVARLIDDVLMAGSPGLVLVCSMRDDEISLLDAFGDTVARASGPGAALHALRLENLGEPGVAAMLARMMRIAPEEAAAMARALAPHAGGNPADTLEVVNALRQAGVLAPVAGGWSWDPAALQRHVGIVEARELLDDRIEGLDAVARELLETLACLRDEVGTDVACIASGLPTAAFESGLAALVEQGLVCRTAGFPFDVRLVHDRLQQVVYVAIPERRRAQIHLSAARRLAAHERGEAAAANQYVFAASSVRDALECRQAAAILRNAARHARSAANHAAARRMLAAALSLLARAAAEGHGDAALRYSCEVDLHLTLYGLGKLEEADTAYARVVAGETDPVRRVDATCVQIRSLCNRGESIAAKALALRCLQDLGWTVPDSAAPVPAGADVVERICAWIGTFDAARELARDDARDPRVVAAAKLLGRSCASAFLMGDAPLALWMVAECQSIWSAHGPCAPLVGALSRAVPATTSTGDMQAGHEWCRELLAFCEARAWGAEAWQCRDQLARCSHWFEPLEQSRGHARRARDGLLASTDLQGACESYGTSIVAEFECAQELQAFAREAYAAVEFAARTGNRYAEASFTPAIQLLRALRGETAGAGAFDTTEFDEKAFVPAHAHLPEAVANFHLWRAVSAALFGDAERLHVHARAATRSLATQGTYAIAWAWWFAGIASAWRLQESLQAGEPEDPAEVEQLGVAIAWLRARAEASPANFRHMHLHLEAEQAWAQGDAVASALMFDRLTALASGLPRPWHRAFLLERAGRFQLAQGRTRGGRKLLALARQHYEAWGATAKAVQLGAVVGLRRLALEAPGTARASSADDLDTLAVLRASQALSSERSPARLKARVEEVLGSVTGATRVVLALWDEDVADWVLRDPAVAGDGGVLALSAAGHLVPLTAVRYAERTREPLLLADAVADDRFARDGYFQGMERCSLMVVPILHQAMMRAMLVLENRAGRGAFSTARLDAVMMIAGQLAVSLESAQLYERLEKKVQDQTQQLRQAQARLVDEARRAGMAQIATNVLHNVGNVLTSVNVSAHVLTERVRGSRAVRVGDLAALLESNASDLGNFFEAHEKGRMLPRYLRELAQALEEEREELLAELGRLGASVDHIKNVVAMQQSYAGATGVLQACSISELVEDALRIQEDALQRSRVRVLRDFAAVEAVPLDKTRVMQILVNLIENARQAMEGIDVPRELGIKIEHQEGLLLVSVSDTGCGIAQDHLTRIFSHGFTTKPGGHGFGLHSCAVAAKEMGGVLTVRSDGPGTGARFILALPSTGRQEPTRAAGAS